jgi:hypothetical protein
MLDSSTSLVLCYDPGQFTFRHFNPVATDAQLYSLALQLNAFQTCAVDKVLKVRVMEF